MNNIKTKIISNNCTNIIKIDLEKNYVIIHTNKNKYLLKKGSKEDRDNRLYLSQSGYQDKMILVDADFEYELYLLEEKSFPGNVQNTMLDELFKIHKSTTSIVNVSDEEKSNIYKNAVNRLDELFNYYYNWQISIQEKIFPSAGEYLLLLNVSKIYKLLNYSRSYLEKWYVLDNISFQEAFLVNIISLNNYYAGEVFIDYSNSSVGKIIEEITNYYRNYYENVSLEEVLDKYDLLEAEKYYLFFLLAMPKKIFFTYDNYNDVVLIRDIIDYSDCLLDYFLKEDKKYQEADQHKFKEEDNNI